MENVLAVHKKYLDMIKEVFQGDQAFIGALDKACNLTNLKILSFESLVIIQKISLNCKFFNTDWS